MKFKLMSKQAHGRNISASDTTSEKNYWSIGTLEISKFDFRYNIGNIPLFGQNKSFFGLDIVTGESFADYFVCDPFVVQLDGTTYLFFEICGYVGRKYTTAIAVTELDIETCKSGPVRLLKRANDKIDGNRTWTISYPYPLIFENQIYLVLEEYSQSNRTNLYKFNNIDFTIKKVNSIETRLLDANLQFHEEMFWLYGIDINYNIRVFFSKSILGRFDEHSSSAKYRSEKFARNAGSVFTHEGRMIRPYQDCSLEYGKSLAFSEITLDIDRGLSMLDTNALSSLRISGMDSNPYWIRNKSHHFTFLSQDSTLIRGLIDGSRLMRITNHGWNTAE